jgi:hypothetical protein
MLEIVWIIVMASSILASPLAKARLAGIAAMVVRRVMQGAAR